MEETIISNVQTLQWWVDKANMGVVVALAASFVFGSASIILSRKLNKQKDSQAIIEKQIFDGAFN